MMEEESWGVLTKTQFDKFLDLFTKRFGKPVHSKRLSFSFWDHNRNGIDTRIRITDGKAEVMQKIGGIGDTQLRVRSEQKLKLPSDLQELLSAYQILRVLIPGDDSCYIYQHDNYIFKQPGFELKITHQIGKTDKYNFEVEVDTKKVDLDKVLKDLGLLDLVTLTNAEFWDKWNEELNLKDSDLDEKQIKDLIEKYLKI
jgi:hypothetical protein